MISKVACFYARVVISTMSVVCYSAFAYAKINVVTTIPEVQWVAETIGGDKVSATALLDGTQNAHYVDAVPEFIRLVANADVVCIVGFDLEIGWIPKVLTKSGNAQVQSGGKGYCDLSKSVAPLEKPAGAVDRSMGHIHQAGNPHYWLSPLHLAQASEEVATVLVRVDPKNAATYKKNQADLVAKLESMHKDFQDQITDAIKIKLSGEQKLSIIQYHSDFVYFIDAYGLDSFGSIEERPGVKPSAGRIALIAKAAKDARIRMALALETDPADTLKKFSELSGIPVVSLPNSMRPNGKDQSLKTYKGLQQYYINKILSKL